MSDMSELDPSLTDLSAAQEESISGGFEMTPILFFQNTEIDSFGEGEMDLATGDGSNASSSSRTGYRYRQTTLAIFGRGNFQMESVFRMFDDLLQRFF